MSEYLSGRESSLKIGIEGYTENKTVLEVIGISQLGIVSATQYIGAIESSINLDGGVTGSLPYQYNTGITSFLDPGPVGYVLLSNGSNQVPYWGPISVALENIGGITIQDEGNVVGSATSIKTINFVGPSVVVTGTSGPNGIATVIISDYFSVSGYSTVSGIASYASLSGLSTYASFSGISSNVIGNIASVNTLNVTGIATLGSVQISSGIITATKFVGDGSGLTNISASGLVGIISYADSSGISTYSNFSGVSTYSNISGISTYSTIAGISTYSTISGIATNVIGGIASVNTLNVTGVVTLGSVEISGGIVTATKFVGDGSSLTNISASSVNYASFSGVSSYANSSGISTYSNISGIATDVIGGIASINSLNVTGVTTLGSVEISGGIVTATKFVGDGSGLINVPVSGLVGIISYADSSGISSNVIGNIVSVNTLNVTGIVTLGSVEISSGIITATKFVGDGSGLTNVPASGLVGVITYADSSGISTYSNFSGVATTLQTARSFEITGDIIASPVFFNGSSNVSLAATIQPNSVELGTDTFGNYVAAITGTNNQITVSGASGEGSSHTISLPSNFVIPEDALISRDLQVNRNLNVNGNITIGGTSALIYATTLTLSDSDIILGLRTDSNGNDISTDNTANHGGISVASTEGNPLVDLYIAGIETIATTYKKFMWFKEGAFAGLGTDSWISNYAIGIGTVQYPVGTRLAVGSIHISEKDITSIRNINATGVITATTFDGYLSGTALNSTTSGIASYAINAGVATYASTSGISTLSQGLSGSPSITVSSISASDINSSGIITGSSFVPSSGYIKAADGTNAFFIYSGSGNVAFQGTIGVSQINNASGYKAVEFTGTTTPTVIIPNNLSVTGPSTISSVQISSGIVTATTFVGDLTGIANTANNLSGGVQGSVPYQKSPGITSFVSPGLVGHVLITSGSDQDPYWGPVSAASGSFGGITIRDEGTIVGTANSITTINFIGPSVSVIATSGSNGIATVTIGDYSSISGYSTTSGIASYATTTGIATYAEVAGIVTYASTSGVSSYAETVGFVSYSTFSGIATYAALSGIATYATTTGIATYAALSGIATNVIGGIASVTELNVTGITTLSTVSVTNLSSQQINNTGITTTNSLNIGVTQVISSARQLQNIASLDSTTIATIESAISDSPNTFTDLNVTGISTLSTANVTNLTTQQLNVTGISTFSGASNYNAQISGSSASFTGIVTAGTFSGQINSGIGTVTTLNSTNANLTNLNSTGIGTISVLNSTTLTTTNASGTNLNYSGIGTITNLRSTSITNTGIATFTNGPVLIGSGTSTGTVSQVLQVTGGGYVSGSLGIGTTLPTSPLYVVGNTFITGILTANRIISSVYGEFTGGSISGSNIVGTALSISGISTLGIVQISSGIVTATSGVVTYYGDGSQLTGISSGITISDDTSTNATRYPTFTSATSGSVSTENVSSTKLTFNPSTGTLSATIFTSLSDKTQKTDIEPIKNALSITNQLQGVRFNWKDNNKPSLGLIAQDVEKIIPEVVNTDNDGIKSVNYDSLVGLLIEAIKEQQILIEELEKKLDA